MVDTAMVKVKKTGVYRNSNGHGVYLTKDSDVPAYVLDQYSLDDGGTKDRAASRENTEVDFTGVVDAGQDDFLAERSEQRIQNKSAAPASSKSDAEIARDAAK